MKIYSNQHSVSVQRTQLVNVLDEFGMALIGDSNEHGLADVRMKEITPVVVPQHSYYNCRGENLVNMCFYEYAAIATICVCKKAQKRR